MKMIPQEVELWYIYPSLRKEIAKSMVEDYGLKQKEVSEKLGITSAAVSNYLKGKRSKKNIFGDKVKIKINKSVKRIVEDGADSTKELQLLLKWFRETKILCEIHKVVDDGVPNKCVVCYEDG